MHGYLFKAFASKAPADYIPSLIGQPTRGAGDYGYFEQVEIADIEIDAIQPTKWVAEGTNDPIMQIRLGDRTILYIPVSELIEQASGAPIVKAALRSGIIRKA